LLGWLALMGLCALASADAPPGRYTDRGDEVVDNETELIWQKHVSLSPTSQAFADEYCDRLQLSNARWRLPSLPELQSIVDVTRFQPAIDQGAFPETPQDFFWTSTVYARATVAAEAWSISFRWGSLLHDATTSAKRVRCVR